MKNLKPKTLLTLAIPAIAILLMSQGCQLLSAEEAYGMTPVGDSEIKSIPASKILETQSEGDYFDKDNNLFMRLFNYIKSNDVAMTVPVEARMKKAKMTFYVGAKDIKKELTDQGQVKVMDAPKRMVASFGVRGGYTEENFLSAKKKLKKWLDKNDRYTGAGETYAVYWNGPFIPSFMKRFEVHIPVKPVEKKNVEEPTLAAKK